MMMFGQSSFIKSWLPVLLLLTSILVEDSLAGPVRDFLVKLKERRTQQQAESLPAGVTKLGDIPYGSEAGQNFDVYFSGAATNRPVIFMVHGGAWSFGDKKNSSLVKNKVARWVPKGFVFISTNYRMLPEADPLVQSQDIARALATAQSQAPSWGGSPSRFILMGHSAGGHLVALLTADPSKVSYLGVKPWLGTVLLDSAALNIEKLMVAKHYPLYDRAFGKDPVFWKSVSPFHSLSSDALPLLSVCSTQRDISVGQSRDFVEKITSLGLPAKVLEQNLSHMEINANLGLSNTYTDAVEKFMGSLDADVLSRLESPDLSQETINLLPEERGF